MEIFMEKEKLEVNKTLYKKAHKIAVILFVVFALLSLPNIIHQTLYHSFGCESGVNVMVTTYHCENYQIEKILDSDFLRISKFITIIVFALSFIAGLIFNIVSWRYYIKSKISNKKTLTLLIVNLLLIFSPIVINILIPMMFLVGRI